MVFSARRLMMSQFKKFTLKVRDERLDYLRIDADIEEVRMCEVLMGIAACFISITLSYVLAIK